MKKKPARSIMAPLQRLTTRDIEDPAEQAAVKAELMRRQQAAALKAAAENERLNGNAASMGKRRPGKAKKRN